MNRALYIIGIVFSLVFFIVAAYYVDEVSSARYSYLFSSSYDTYNSYSSMLYSDGSSDLTMEAGMVSMFFFLYFIFADIMGIVKVKTTTMRVFGILGLSITGLFFLWNIGMLSSPSSMSFDEVGIGFMFYCFISLAFSIVGLIQSVRFKKRKGKIGIPSKELLDS